MVVCGIDPGKDGALAVLDGSRVLHAIRTCEIIGELPWAAAAPVLASHLRGVVADHAPGLAVLELYAGRAGEGRGSLLTIGAGWGVWRGLLAGLGVPTITPSSSAWTRAMFRDRAGEGKDRAVSLVADRLPTLDLRPGRCKKPHLGIADAACLAMYGATR